MHKPPKTGGHAIQGAHVVLEPSQSSLATASTEQPLVAWLQPLVGTMVR